MLNIYTGREDIDKQRYMFARIRRQDLEAEHRQSIFLIVPDQFTLETERSAFAYMDVPAFVNPVVLSMNRLAGKALAEAGERTDHIDRYGNYMLLARLLYRNKGRLSLYRNLENSTGFIAQLSEAVMSLKSHLVSPEKLAECAAAAERGGAGGVLLGRKLRDVAALYAEYEASLSGSLPDGADIARRFAELIPKSKLLAGAVCWVFGFDYFSPLHLKALGAMAARASEVNVVLTAEKGNPFFALTAGLVEELEKAAAEAGAETQVYSVKKDAAERGIDCSWLPEDEKPPEIAHIEKNIFEGPVRAYASEAGRESSALKFVAAQNRYAEAEAAAREIVRLIAGEGLRWRDILVVCNDQDRRAAAIQRVFASFGIETFLDKRHDAGYNPVLAYIALLPEIAARGRRAEDVLAWIGTGLTDVCDSDAEELENYAERYGLRGGDWQKPLTRGADAYGAESFARISNAAKYAGDMIALFSERFGAGGSPAGSARTARARTEGLKAFLEEDARLPEKVAACADRLEAEGFLEYASRMRGVWAAALEIFAQIGAALGDVVTSAEEYATVLRVGFASVMMGVLPASSDCVTIGTMQRTRTGRVKAMFVLGANDGELPLFAEDDGLFDDSEKEMLEGLELTAFRREENLHDEEQLAIYKNLSKPTRLLHVSYTAFGEDGKEETKPSRVFDRLRALFPDTPLEKAAEPEGDEPKGDGSYGPSGTGQANRPLLAHSLGAEKMRALLPGVLSPTAIEKYSRCPFAFLMERGLRLRELRRHEIDNRGMGDIYHEALRRFGEAMNEKGGPPANGASAWNTAARPDTDAVVGDIFRELEAAAERRKTAPAGADEPAALVSEEGALLFDKDDPAAVYRRGRLEAIVRDVCWILTERAKAGGAERILFETEFGAGGEFDRVRPGGGLEIAGRIDRIDILPGGRAKVIDYKSGAEKWSAANVKNGWQLQLMLYLKAVESGYEPAGVSYFRIFEPRVNLSDPKAPSAPDEIRGAAEGLYRGDGVALKSEGADDALPGALPGEKELTKEEFDSLRAEADKRLAEIAEGLSRGEVPANPKQKAGGDSVTACTYCDYRSICNYEAT